MKKGHILIRAFNHIEEACLSVTFSVMALVCFIQVITRYCFHYSLPWSEEFLRALFVWSSCLGISWGFKTQSHLGVDALVNAFPERFKKVFALWTYLVVLVFCVTIIYFSLQITTKHFITNQVTIALKLPIGYVSSAIPVSFSLTIIRVLQVMYEDFRKKKQDKTTDEVHISEGLL